MLKLRPILLTLCLFTLAACNDNSANNLDQLIKKEWTVINYWATWCKPCIEEIPELNELAENHQQILTVLGVDFDKSQGAELEEKIKKLGITFTVLEQEPTEQLGFSRPTVLPTTVIINSQKQVHKILTGPQTQQSILDAIQSKP